MVSCFRRFAACHNRWEPTIAQIDASRSGVADIAKADRMTLRMAQPSLGDELRVSQHVGDDRAHATRPRTGSRRRQRRKSRGSAAPSFTIHPQLRCGGTGQNGSLRIAKVWQERRNLSVRRPCRTLSPDAGTWHATSACPSAWQPAQFCLSAGISGNELGVGVAAVQLRQRRIHMRRRVA